MYNSSHLLTIRGTTYLASAFNVDRVYENMFDRGELCNGVEGMNLLTEE
jgi:hypothetical protein